METPARIEEIMRKIKREYTIGIVTLVTQHAARGSDRSAFVRTEVNTESGLRSGVMVELLLAKDALGLTR